MLEFHGFTRSFILQHISMASSYRVEVAQEEDIAFITDIVIPAFEKIPVEHLFGDTTTADGRRAYGERHLYAWREHAKQSNIPCAIKCVHHDAATGKDTIVGFAEWFIYDRHRESEEYNKLPPVLDSILIEDAESKEKLRKWLKPVIDVRVKWMGGRPYGCLNYMAVDPAWRRKGASTLCVQWGLNECRRLGIPALLEASDEGRPVYERLGFDTVDTCDADFDTFVASFPVMIWWPPGTADKDKKPAIP